MSVGDQTLRNLGAASRDPLLGQLVGDYRVESVIGSGAMGIVYKGQHEMIGKAVAIKVLKAEISDDPDMVARLVREARTVNAIHHPGIVDIFGFGNLPTGQPYVVMDLLIGEPMDAWIDREAPASPTAWIPLIDALLSALGAAHDVGVIHRDLKPGNVFLEKSREGPPRVKLLDFGLARQADRAQGSVRPTNPGTLLGTPAFMAPEQVMGQRVGPMTDLYAVGGIAYQMCTKRLPHEAPSAVEVLSAKMLQDAVPPTKWNPNLDAELVEWIMALLHREPDKRPPHAEQIRGSLRRIGERLSRRPTGSRAQTTPKRQWGEAKTILASAAEQTLLMNPAPAQPPPQAAPPRAGAQTVFADGVEPTFVPGEAPPADMKRPWEAQRPATAVVENALAAAPTQAQVPNAATPNPGPRSTPPAAVSQPIIVPRSKAPYVVVGVLGLLVLLAVLYLVVR